jgi:hypothetical protein
MLVGPAISMHLLNLMTIDVTSGRGMLIRRRTSMALGFALDGKKTVNQMRKCPRRLRRVGRGGAVRRRVLWAF